MFYRELLTLLLSFSRTFQINLMWYLIACSLCAALYAKFSKISRNEDKMTKIQKKILQCPTPIEVVKITIFFSNLRSQFWIIFWISDLQHCPCFILANFKLWKFDIWPHLRSRNFNFGQKLLILDFDKKCLDLDYCTKYINSLSWKHCGKYFVEL